MSLALTKELSLSLSKLEVVFIRIGDSLGAEITVVFAGDDVVIAGGGSDVV